MGKFQVNLTPVINTNCQFYVAQQLQLKISANWLTKSQCLWVMKCLATFLLEDVEIENTYHKNNSKTIDW